MPTWSPAVESFLDRVDAITRPYPIGPPPPMPRDLMDAASLPRRDNGGSPPVLLLFVPEETLVVRLRSSASMDSRTLARSRCLTTMVSGGERVAGGEAVELPVELLPAGGASS